jgi:hypothetical protein
MTLGKHDEGKGLSRGLNKVLGYETIASKAMGMRDWQVCQKAARWDLNIRFKHEIR